MSSNKRDHSQSMMEKINASEMPAKKPLAEEKTIWPKSDARYWLVNSKNRIFKNHDSQEYSCRFTKQKRREHFALGTPNKKAAAAKAAEIYSHLKAHGWDATLQKYRPKSPEPKLPTTWTVGAFIEAACRTSAASPGTLNAYTKAFRLIVSEIHKIDRDGIFDSVGGGSLEWRKKVDGIEMASIKPLDVQTWKISRLKTTKSPLDRIRAGVTVNSLMRNSKSLFGKKILPFIEQHLPLPRPLPFDGVIFENKESMRYKSKIDSKVILKKAKKELSESDPEAFKVVLLALFCGLRRSEIDYLLWNAFDFTNSKLSIETTEYHALKSKNSAGIIDIDDVTLSIFSADRAKNPKAIFVINSSKSPKTSKGREYRCDDVFTRVLTWLRAQDVESSKPIHTLRKEIGSVINHEYGIYAASCFLRHSDIRITAEYYLDNKVAVTPKSFAGWNEEESEDTDQSGSQ